MGIAQRRFNEACEYYEHAQGLVKKVGESICEMEQATKGSSEFDPKITMREFDLILQGVLLSEALADHNFDRLEKQFIEKITNYADLLEFIIYATDKQIVLSWDDVSEMDSEIQEALVEALPAMLESKCKDFIAPFLIIDKIVEKVDFLGILVDDIAKIGIMLSDVDGKTDEAEGEALKAMLTTLLIDPWFEMLENDK